MKKISLFLLSLIMIFGLNTSVYAVNTENDGSGESGDKLDYSDDANRIVTDSSYFRACFNDTNGNTVFCRDFSNNEWPNAYVSDVDTVKKTLGNSKPGYIASGTEPVFSQTRDIEDAFESTDALAKILASNGFNVPDFSKIEDSSNINIEELSKIFEEENFDSKKSGGRTYEESLTAVIEQLSKNTTSDYLEGNNDLDLTDLTMTIETGSCWRLLGVVHCGTINELVHEALQTEPVGKWKDTSSAINNFGWDALINYSCSGYLNGNLGEDISNENFTSDSYFGNKIDIVDIPTSSASACSNYLNQLKDSGNLTLKQLAEMLQDSGLAMGVIAFEKYIQDPPEINCEVLQKYAGDSTKYMCSDTESLTSFAEKFKNSSDRPAEYDIYADALLAAPELYTTICGCEEELTCDIINKYASVSDTFKCTDTAGISAIISNFQNSSERPKGYDSIAESMTPDLYIEYCGCDNKEPEKKPACEPLKVVSTCGAYAVQYQEAKNYTYNTEPFWSNCVDSTEDVAPDAAEFFEGALGDPSYCPVYCEEKLKAQYDNNIPKVNTGFHFEWPDSSNIKVKGSRVCKIQERKLSDGTIGQVDWQKYMDDLAKINKAMRDDYYTYMVETEKQNQLGSIKTTIASPNCDCRNKITETIYFDCNTHELKTGDFVKEEACSTTVTKCDPVNPGYYDLHEYTGPAVNIKLHYKIYEGNGKWNESTMNPTTVKLRWCDPDPAPTANPSYNYEFYKKQIDALIERMTKCYTWDPDTVYNTDPYANLIYSDGKYYDVKEALEGRKTDSGLSEEEYVCEGNNETILNLCNGQKENGNCNPSVTYAVNKCTKVKMKREITYTYYMPGGLYEYVMKDDNRSVHSPYGYSDYIDIGHSNLPVSYGATEGKLAIEYGALGHDGRLDSKFSDQTSYGYWSCGVNFYDELIDEQEMNVIFRPIDLSNPFPDITAGGRITGSNWCDNGYCGTDAENSVVTNVITKKTDIYNKEPMYVFELTPLAIMRIRGYNKTVSEGYADFNLDCETATGNACISTFLSDLIKGDYSNVCPEGTDCGKCNKLNYRITKSDTFYQCQN